MFVYNFELVYMVKTFKIFRTSPMTLKLGMDDSRSAVYIDDDPWLTLTDFTARSTLVTYVFIWGKLSHLMGKKLS